MEELRNESLLPEEIGGKDSAHRPEEMCFPGDKTAKRKEAAKHSETVNQCDNNGDDNRHKFSLQDTVTDQKGGQSVDKHTGPDMIGRAGEDPDQQASAADDHDKDIDKDLPTEQGKEETQNKEGDRVADKMPEIDMEKVAQRNTEQAAGCAWNDPIGIEPEREVAVLHTA